MRHCQTFGNARGIGMGIKETQWSTLSLKGVNQAVSIAYRLSSAGEDFSKYKFIATPMIRTQQTLRIILDILGLENLEVEIEPLINSKNKGVFENMLKDEIKRLYPDEVEKKKLDYWNYKAPNGGESMDDLYKKISRFIYKYKDDKNIVIAMHETGCRVLKSVIEGKIPNKMEKESFIQNQNYFMSWDGKQISTL
jgi:probable phosphoglycerate mutase